MDAFEKIPILAVVGPTASGKTALAVRLAKEFDAEVVSADSMQIYTGLSVSTAKPTVSEMQGVPHHLLDFLSPDTPFSVADYCTLAKETIADIHARGKRVILCGGTGLYVQSLLDNLDFSGEGADLKFRAELQKLADTQGTETVWRRLQAVDPQGAETLHPNNLGRVIRALEINQTTGRTIAEQRAFSRKNPSPYASLILCLDFRDRQKLYDRIHLRVEQMCRDGLEAEVSAFRQTYGGRDGTAVQAIGCKELLPYFDGECSLEQALDAVKKETRHYAKRQLTWFRRMDNVQMLYADESSDLFSEACARVRNSGLWSGR